MTRLLAALVLTPAMAVAQQTIARPQSEPEPVQAEQKKSTETGQQQIEMSRKRALAFAQRQKELDAERGVTWNTLHQATSDVGPGSAKAYNPETGKLATGDKVPGMEPVELAGAERD